MAGKRPLPPGARWIKGILMVPFQGPKPRKRMPVGHAGGYAAEVDTTGMDEAMKRTLRINGRRKKR